MNRSTGLRTLVKSAIVVGCLSTAAIVHARGVSTRGGDWPENWPQELEPFRERAESVSYGTTVWTQYYVIEFDSREAFESVWPTVLKLKSKDAPISLQTPDKPKSDPNDPRVVYDKPTLWIICPPRDDGTYEQTSDETYQHIGPWSEDLESLDTLPQYAGKQKKDGKWVAWKNSAPLSDYEGAARQARVELGLYVDGEIIDLNRIHIPKETPIKDNRTIEQNE